MGYDRIRFRALQVAEKILEKGPFTTVKEKLVEAFCEGVAWEKQQQPRNQVTEFSNQMQQIQNIVVQYFGIECYDIWERTRFKEVVDPRRWVWFWWNKKLGLSYLEISKYCGFARSTVVFGVEAIEADSRVYAPMKRDYDHLKKLMDAVTL